MLPTLRNGGYYVFFLIHVKIIKQIYKKVHTYKVSNFVISYTIIIYKAKYFNMAEIVYILGDPNPKKIICSCIFF
jgi:hypothetical protein